MDRNRWLKNPQKGQGSPSKPKQKSKQNKSKNWVKLNKPPGHKPLVVKLSEERKTGPRLPGYVFGCTNQTERECFDRELFGLPSPHGRLVSKIKPGTPLFLFNYNKRILYGVFEAVSQGGIDLVPEAWAGQFPAQIHVRIPGSVHQLEERQFKDVLKANYFSTSRFLYLLTEQQVDKLCAKFGQPRGGATMERLGAFKNEGLRQQQGGRRQRNMSLQSIPEEPKFDVPYRDVDVITARPPPAPGTKKGLFGGLRGVTITPHSIKSDMQIGFGQPGTVTNQSQSQKPPLFGGAVQSRDPRIAHHMQMQMQMQMQQGQGPTRPVKQSVFSRLQPANPDVSMDQSDHHDNAPRFAQMPQPNTMQQPPVNWMRPVGFQQPPQVPMQPSSSPPNFGQFSPSQIQHSPIGGTIHPTHLIQTQNQPQNQPVPPQFPPPQQIPVNIQRPPPPVQPVQSTVLKYYAEPASFQLPLAQSSPVPKPSLPPLPRQSPVQQTVTVNNANVQGKVDVGISNQTVVGGNVNGAVSDKGASEQAASVQLPVTDSKPKPELPAKILSKLKKGKVSKKKRNSRKAKLVKMKAALSEIKVVERMWSLRKRGGGVAVRGETVKEAGAFWKQVEAPPATKKQEFLDRVLDMEYDENEPPHMKLKHELERFVAFSWQAGDSAVLRLVPFVRQRARECEMGHIGEEVLMEIGVDQL